LRRELLAFGIVLVFVGLLLIPVGVSSKSLYFASDTASERVTRHDSWSIEGYFEENRKLTLSIGTNPDWGWVAADFIGDFPKEFSKLESVLGNKPFIYLRINVTDPDGGNTSFCVLYLQGPSGDTPEPPPLTVFGIAVSSNDGGLTFSGLEVPKQGEYLYLDPRIVGDKICGITTLKGVYKVSVRRDPTLSSLGNPRKLELWSEIIVEDHPYLFLVPLGIGISGFGLASSLWAVRRTSRRRLRKFKTSKA